MKLIAILAFLLAGCASISFIGYSVGDCIEAPLTATAATCWGTIDDISNPYDSFVLINVSCDGTMKGQKKARLVLPLDKLQYFKESTRCK